MPETILVAVPSETPGGLEASPSAHFGHCPIYTIAKIHEGKISNVQVMANGGHEEGGCVQPVKELAKLGVKALLAGGMGQKPLAAMHDAGIKVYYCTGMLTVQACLEAFAQGKLPEFGADQLCRGCHGEH